MSDRSGQPHPLASQWPSPQTEREDGETRDNWHRWQALSGAWEISKPLARKMRHEPTQAEAVLWKALRGGQLGLRFRRQHALGRYIVDFYCPWARLAIEVDGAGHNRTRAEDEERTAFLESKNVEVLRFTNDQIEQNLERVMERITEVLGRRNTTSLSPFAERGPGGEV